MAANAAIYQASDLNQRGRAILDEARSGQARVRDKDGLSLVVLPEQRLRALEIVASSLTSFLLIEHSLQEGHGRADAFHLGEWTWLRAFDTEDLREFLEEMREALVVAARELSTDMLDNTLNRWRITAQELDDVQRRSVLLGANTEQDFVEVPRPR